MTPMQRAEELIDKLCNDPEMWATHGMPGVEKLDRLQMEIAEAITAAVIAALKDTTP